ncbi:tail fiber domain-containing protein [Spirosoma validum]|uniref:Tail fiber domain-containing protein n=1 Tax=Spirosoma validum TaxID=2771355 RepID=A0A927GCH1_9BACT|nr:tail fiber domain-containing protein [Spirosoma validum]MBD2752633.1 tail fiber domain-containing protein [Spirosoma validum]
MKQFFLLAAGLLSSASLYAQVGIGTTTPKAFFNVAEGKDVLFGQTLNFAGDDNDDTPYIKLIWHASKAAFRAGIVQGDMWDSNRVGYYSFAAGYNAHAGGNQSVALGSGNEATGGGSIAIGTGLTASGNNSVAMGTSVGTNGYLGSFIFGDRPAASYYTNTTANQMMMRFAGGYRLYSTNPQNQSAAIGVQVVAGSNAWSVISDSTRKENFRNVDGASFLQKIAQLRLGSWNYKGQDAKTYRHYGPMAQDFFAAFGHDELGIIGEDKSINQADFDGVNLIAIQALIEENQQLKARLAAMEKQESLTQARLDQIEAALQGQMTSSALTLKP